MTPLQAANERSAEITAGPVRLPGILAWPRQPSGMVLFVHGSGSGRLSPRNAAVAQQLRAAGLGTLLFDLLTEVEAADRRNVFDIDLLSERLLAATMCLTRQPETTGLPLGYFGASTGARLVVIPGASHLFEEPGTLEEAGRLAAAWLVQHLARQPSVGSHS